MENIYNAWNTFISSESNRLTGEDQAQWLNHAESVASRYSNFPYPGGEDWKYVSFGNLKNTSLHWPQAGESKNSVYETDDTFVVEISDFATSLNDSQVIEGLTLGPDALGVFSSSFGNIENPFWDLAQAFPGSGIQLALKQGLSKPLMIKLNLDGLRDKDYFGQFNIHLALEEGINQDVYLDVCSQEFRGLFNLCVQSSLKAKAKLGLYNKQGAGSEGFVMVNHKGDLAKDAELKNFDFTFPSSWTRHNLQVNLLEKGARAELRGSYLNNEKQFADHHTSIFHGVGETFSEEDYRGILSGHAHGVFNGKVYIAEKAAKANSNQINKNLMLSKKAQIDTKPELQIFNDDVKATHGATIGRLDEDQRFYLQSRGYSFDEASKILARAFVYDLLEDQSEYTKKFYEQELTDSLKTLGGP